MAYAEDLADSVRELLADDGAVTEKKMFGGLAFLLNGNMAVSASGQGGLLVRIDPAETGAAIAEPHRIKAGKRKTVTLKLTRRDVNKLRRNRRRGKKTRGVLTSVEKGRKGRKTTIRSPRLRLR